MRADILHGTAGAWISPLGYGRLHDVPNVFISVLAFSLCTAEHAAAGLKA